MANIVTEKTKYFIFQTQCCFPLQALHAINSGYASIQKAALERGETYWSVEEKHEKKIKPGFFRFFAALAYSHSVLFYGNGAAKHGQAAAAGRHVLHRGV
jgi:hypothetical protein